MWLLANFCALRAACWSKIDFCTFVTRNRVWERGLEEKTAYEAQSNYRKWKDHRSFKPAGILWKAKTAYEAQSNYRKWKNHRSFKPAGILWKAMQVKESQITFSMSGSRPGNRKNRYESNALEERLGHRCHPLWPSLKYLAKASAHRKYNAEKCQISRHLQTFL